MHLFSFALTVAVAVAVAIAAIAIGLMYLSNPRGATQSFGLPLPEPGPNVAWWLRLKGVRDVATGLVILTLLIWAGRGSAGIALLTAALVPLGDLFTILAARGSTARAFGIHGLTAVLMVVAGVLLILGR